MSRCQYQGGYGHNEDACPTCTEEQRDRYRKALESAATLIESESPRLALVTIQTALLPE